MLPKRENLIVSLCKISADCKLQISSVQGKGTKGRWEVRKSRNYRRTGNDKKPGL